MAHPEHPDALQAVHALMDEYRARCLWYWRDDYYPTTREDAFRVLDATARHGDLAACERVAELKEWL